MMIYRKGEHLNTVFISVVQPTIQIFQGLTKYLYYTQPFQYIVTIPIYIITYTFNIIFLSLSSFPILIRGKWMGEHLNTACLYNSGATLVYSPSFNRRNQPLARSCGIEVSVFYTAHPFTCNLLIMQIAIDSGRENF